MNPRASSTASPVVALVLGLVIPGAGHAYAGRWGKAILFFSLITGLVAAGMILGQGTVLKIELWYAAQLWAGGPVWALTPLSYLATWGPVDYASRVHEIATLYTAVAGFLNLLVMMDAYIRVAYPDRHATEEEG
jgi:TM2 domain-containing membrane protein YozV